MSGKNSVLGGGGFHHVAINAADFDKTHRFYTEVMGMAEAHAWQGGGGRAAAREVDLLAPNLDRAAGPLGMWVVAAISWIVVGLCCLAMISYTRLGLSFVAEGQKPLEASSGNQSQTNESDQKN